MFTFAKETISLLIAVGAAFLLAGGFVGFIFGIPKVLQQESAPPAAGGGKGSLNDTVDARLMQNTNLEQISDWLTKIIVGIGLAEFNDAKTQFLNIAHKIGAAHKIGGGENLSLTVLPPR